MNSKPTREYFKHRSNSIEKRIEYRKRSQWKATKEKSLFYNARHRALRDSLEFTLNFSDIFIPEICPVLGIILDRSNKKLLDNSPSLDRIDNTRGYTKDNIIVVSWRANKLKGNGSPEEHLKIADFYSRLQESSN